MKSLSEYIDNNDRLKDFISQNKDMLIKVAAVFLVIVAAFVVFALKGDGQEVSEKSKATTEDKVVAAKVFVDIGGEVNTPMLAELDEGSRVEDAIKAAGGLTENADLANINRAAFVNDGDKIYIPSLLDVEDSAAAGNEGSAGGNSVGGAAYGHGKININTADTTQLQQITGVGPVTAEKIINYREENGRFNSIEDIKNVSGIGDKTYEKLKDEITV